MSSIGRGVTIIGGGSTFALTGGPGPAAPPAAPAKTLSIRDLSGPCWDFDAVDQARVLAINQPDDKPPYYFTDGLSWYMGNAYLISRLGGRDFFCGEGSADCFSDVQWMANTADAVKQGPYISLRTWSESPEGFQIYVGQPNRIGTIKEPEKIGVFRFEKYLPWDEKEYGDMRPVIHLHVYEAKGGTGYLALRPPQGGLNGVEGWIAEVVSLSEVIERRVRWGVLNVADSTGVARIALVYADNTIGETPRMLSYMGGNLSKSLQYGSKNYGRTFWGKNVSKESGESSGWGFGNTDDIHDYMYLGAWTNNDIDVFYRSNTMQVVTPWSDAKHQLMAWEPLWDGVPCTSVCEERGQWGTKRGSSGAPMAGQDTNYNPDIPVPQLKFYEEPYFLPVVITAVVVILIIIYFIIRPKKT